VNLLKVLGMGDESDSSKDSDPKANVIDLVDVKRGNRPILMRMIGKRRVRVEMAEPRCACGPLFFLLLFFFLKKANRNLVLTSHNGLFRVFLVNIPEKFSCSEEPRIYAHTRTHPRPRTLHQKQISVIHDRFCVDHVRARAFYTYMRIYVCLVLSIFSLSLSNRCVHETPVWRRYPLLRVLYWIVGVRFIDGMGKRLRASQRPKPWM